jgi:tetratricopeptide (TPR) repeat protein
MPSTDTFFADVEQVIADFGEADVPRIRQMLAELDKIARDLPRTAARCHAYQARLHSRLGEHEQALASINHAIAGAPKDASLLIHRGRIYAEAGRYAEGIADFNHVLADDPEAVQALVHRGNAYRALGDRARARADYTAALNLEPGSQPIRDKLRELGKPH